MADVHELRTIKDFAVTLAFHICAHEPTHPIVVDDDRRKDFQLAEGLKRDQCKEYKLLGDIEGTFSIIRLGEELRIMKPNIVNSQIFPTMDSELVG